jgi:hypothetical protein
MLRTVLLGALLAACLSPLLAQEQKPAEVKVGDAVAEFTPHNWINPPTWTSFASLKGDVILIKAWGIN